MFSLHYTKTKPLDIDSLVKNHIGTITDTGTGTDTHTVEDPEYNPFLIENIQNYNPIYSSFFELNETNYDRISLNHKYQMVSMDKVRETATNTIVDRPVFIKYSPLLDPMRYMIGKYVDEGETIRILPKLTNTTSEEAVSKPASKLTDINNASYIDNFFCYLSSQTLNHYGLLNSLDYYGSNLGIQTKFKMNITDDVEYLHGSEFFNRNRNTLFSVPDVFDENEFDNIGSRSNRNRLCINNDDALHNISITQLDDVLSLETEPILTEINELVYEKQKDVLNNHSSPSSSGTSNNSEMNYSSDEDSVWSTEDESDDESDDESSQGPNDRSDNKSSDDQGSNDNEPVDNESCNKSIDNESCDESIDDESGSGDGSSEGSEDSIFAYISNFPVQMICLEKCDGTLDRLFMKHQMDEHTGASALMQVIMTLIAYQKMFKFTHNDLHTNNIMYVDTEIDYLYYKYNHKTYQVPTYGRLFKIIDFGRSIYTFQGKIFGSDSFAPGGDAATQYNCEPYFNPDKPRIDPNDSFDLCRLGCSIYDFIVDDEDEDEDSIDELQKTIIRWCTDDNGKNILYKRNGEERYPNFKLYKMIARTVHQHTPQQQLEFPYFAQFCVEMDVPCTLIDIDAMPGL